MNLLFIRLICFDNAGQPVLPNDKYALCARIAYTKNALYKEFDYSVSLCECHALIFWNACVMHFLHNENQWHRKSGDNDARFD
jgi:hypothetical protein